MPLYDCMLLLKPHVRKELMMDLVAKVGKHVYKRNGVITDIKSYGSVQLGYGIKKLDGKYFQGQMLQMTMMSPPSFNSELHYLNKEDRLLRWLLVKHRDVKVGMEYFGDLDLDNDLEPGGLGGFRSHGLLQKGDTDDDDDDTSSDDDDHDNDSEGNFGNNDAQGGLLFSDHGGFDDQTTKMIPRWV